MDWKSRYDKALKPITDLMVTYPWADKKAYAGFLAQTFYYTRHSTKLLTLAASRFDFADYDLHRRFIVHSQEERGHEFMCQKDLSLLHMTVQDMPEQASTAAFYQRQYYLIEHVDPICFLGYVLCLEGLSANAAGPARDQVKAAHTEKAALFLRAHSDEDPDHIEKAFKALEGLSAARLELVMENLEMSCSLYADVMRESCAIAQKNSAKRVA